MALKKTIPLIGFIIILFSCNDSGKDNIRTATIARIDASKDRLVKFAQYLQINVDTNFYIENRSKDNRYFFFYFKDGTIKGSFVPDSDVMATVKNECDFFRFRHIWKFEGENFYRLNLEYAGKQLALVLVLQPGHDKFQYSNDSAIPKLPVVTNVEQVDESIKTPFVFELSKSILIYYK